MWTRRPALHDGTEMARPTTKLIATDAVAVYPYILVVRLILDSGTSIIRVQFCCIILLVFWMKTRGETDDLMKNAL